MRRREQPAGPRRPGSRVGGRRARSARPAQDLAGPAAELEVLFRLLVESGASDLHLRTGEPPMLRNHGELARQAFPALTAERLDNMLVSIMTAKELG